MENVRDKIKEFMTISSGSGSGSGSGYGDGSGSGYGYGDGSGSGSGLEEFNGQRVFQIDDVPTLINSVHGNYAKGHILREDLTLQPCFIVKVEGRYFAHGETLREAIKDARSKALQNMSEEERIEKFVKELPTLETIVANSDLFQWHNILTGSCEMGRRTFAQEHGIDIENGSMSVKEFIELTKDAYGGEIIKKLKERYETGENMNCPQT